MTKEDIGKYAIIGTEPKYGQSKKAWVVLIDEYKKIDPKQYFITTGEGTVKVKVLIDDIKVLLKEAQKLQKQLIKTKGESDYLETCWEDGKLIMKKKERRIKGAAVEEEVL